MNFAACLALQPGGEGGGCPSCLEEEIDVIAAVLLCLRVSVLLPGAGNTPTATTAQVIISSQKSDIK